MSDAVFFPIQRAVTEPVVVPDAAGQPSPPPSPEPGTQQTQDKTLIEALQEAREKIEKNRDKFKLKSTVRYGDIPLTAYAKLGKARNKYEVNAAASYSRRQIGQLQQALRKNPESAKEIRAAIQQLQKAQMRASRKIRDLDREAVLEQHRKKAEQQRQAIRLKNELQRRRAARTIREGAYIREAAISSYMQRQMEAALDDFKLPSGGQTGTDVAPTGPSPAVPMDSAGMPSSISILV